MPAVDFARAYARRGWHVLPLKPGEKTPLNGQGLTHATRDEATIITWFAACPDAGIGIALAPSGLAAIDIDPRHGGDLELRDRLPATLTAATGGGGLHLVYRVPAGARVRASLGPGIDVKHKGYIAAEPSLHPSGRRYGWLDFEPLEAEVPQIAEAPAELFEPDRQQQADPSGPAYSEGGRNVALTRLAGKLRRDGLSAEALAAALLQVNAERCRPPLAEAEVRGIAASVGRYEAGPDEGGGGAPLNVDLMFADCRVTEEFVKDVHEAHFVWKHVIAAAHLCVWAAPGGNGKSTIARRAAADMARDGLRVLYFMEDAGATDFKFLAEHAAANGYTLLNSTAGRKSPDEIFALIRRLAESPTRLDDYVLILDTLKKFLDVMGKQGAREFFRVLRAVAVLGGTVLALGHTNKHAGLDGKPVFEGVGDIRNDIDELFYLDAIDDGTDRLVTIRADKVRCLAEPCSFRLVRGSLHAVDEPLTDVAALAAVAQRERADERVVNAVLEVLRQRGGGENSEALAAEAAKLLGVGVKRVRAVIRDYSDENALPRSTRWLVTRIPLNNTVRVSLPPT